MELIGVDRSKIVSLFFVSNPEGQPIRSEMAFALTQKYGFAVAPSKIEELQADKVIFGQGSFQGVSIESLEVYSDGIIATAKSPSDKLDAFLEDLLSWSEATFGMKRIETHKVNTVYESHIIVKADPSILSIMDGLNSLRIELQKNLLNTSNITAQVEQFGYSFAVDQTAVAGLKPISFRLERKQDASFTSNLFYSSAPLKTEDHLALLKKAETIGKKT